MNAPLQLVGRVLFGMIFVMNGIMGHFMQLEMMSGYSASKGVPMPTVMVIITGLMILVGGLAVITGYKPKIGLWLLVAFLVPTALIMHNFWAVGADQRMAEMAHFLKDLALAGGALMLLQTDVESWPYSLGGGGKASAPADMPSSGGGADVG